MNLYIIAGCNGAGKTTASFTVLPEMLDCREFVNADEIARGLSPFNPDGMAFAAGRLMLERMEELLAAGADFAFETTLATRSYAPLIERARACGYVVALYFFWLPTPQQAVERVADRVSKGGHNIPEAIIYRRYERGLRNLRERYMPLCDSWTIYDNNAPDCGLRLIAAGGMNEPLYVEDEQAFQTILNYE